MKRIIPLAVASVALVFAPRVEAQVTQNVCSGAAPVCATAMYTLNSSHSLTIWVYNGTDAASAATSSTLTDLFLWGLPSGTTFSGAAFWDYTGSGYTTTSVSSFWTFVASSGTGPLVGTRSNLDGPGGSGGITTCAGPGTVLTGMNPNKRMQTCSTGPVFGSTSDYVAFSFALGGAGLTNGQLSQLNWGFHAQSIPANSNPSGLTSVWCVSASGLTTDPAAHYCAPPDDPGTPTEVVPEPATMALLATGLAGMAAVGTRRRKREREQQQA